MKMSVAISTWNRANSLHRTLESIADAIVPPGLAWEVIVINNNSTDDTDSVIDGFAGRLPIRRFFEPIQGVSHARNAAASAARGEFILWTDDDVIVSSRWVLAYCQAFERWPKAVLFGGPIRPVFEEPTPQWLKRGWNAVPSAFAMVDLGKDPIAFSVADKRIPYGANFAIRRTEQLKHLFNPALGPGTKYYAEETTMIIELLRQRAEGRWVPDAAVDHIIPSARMTTDYIWSYYKKIGRTNYYIDHQRAEDTETLLFGRPRWLWRSVAEGEMRYWLCRAFRPPHLWLAAFRTRALAWGAFEESARRRATSAANNSHSDHPGNSQISDCLSRVDNKPKSCDGHAQR